MGKPDKPDETRVNGGQRSSGALPEKIGKYRIDSMLGKGGMGVVYLGRDSGLDRQVAVKTLYQMAEDVPSEEAKQLIQRFIREARSIAKLNHPSIVTIYNVGKQGGKYFIAMEYVEGKALSWIIKTDKNLALEEKLKIVVQICQGLKAIHDQGLIHRDIKPSNIMVKEDGAVKIMDFGLVHTEDSELTRTTQILGTPHYMAPEQFSGGPVDQRSDIFSLGGVFYELVTGIKAFGGSTLSTIAYKIINDHPSLPSQVEPMLSQGEVDGIIVKALAKNPAERYSSCEELLNDVEALLAGEPATVITPPSSTKPETLSRVIVFHSSSVVALLQNPFGMPIEIEIDEQFSASLKRKEYVETQLSYGEHRLALRHSEKLAKSIKYTSDHTFSVTGEATYIEVTSKLASTNFRLRESLPSFFKKEYAQVEPEG